MPNSVQEIRDKYLHDVSHIEDYVHYLEDYFLSSFRLIGSIDSVSPTFSANRTIDNLCDNNGVIQSEISEYLQQLAHKMRSLNVTEKRPNEPSGQDPTVEGDMIFYLLSAIHKGEEDPDKLFKDAQSQVEAMCITKGDLVGFEDYLLLDENPDRIRQLVGIALEEAKRRQYRSFAAKSEHVRMTAKSLELFEACNQTNLYKQNFIQTMAYFDSCIFDIVRSCMEQRFFEWLLFFDNVSIRTHELASHNSFDAFRKSHIESALKKCYVKDLLKILRSNFSEVFVIDGIDVYPLIQEMIGRRNAHIHHNGAADQMYLEQFNLFNVEQGEYLKITKAYFDKTISVTKQVISSIVTTCG